MIEIYNCYTEEGIAQNAHVARVIESMRGKTGIPSENIASMVLVALLNPVGYGQEEQAPPEYVYRVVNENGDAPNNVYGRRKLYASEATAKGEATRHNNEEQRRFAPGGPSTPPRTRYTYTAQRSAVKWEDLP